jgi:hypothetical protein
MQDLRWTKWYWNKFFFEYLVWPWNSIQRCAILILSSVTNVTWSSKTTTMLCNIHPLEW